MQPARTKMIPPPPEGLDVVTTITRIRGYLSTMLIGLMVDQKAARQAFMRLGMDAIVLLHALETSVREGEPVLVVPETDPAICFDAEQDVERILATWQIVRHLDLTLPDDAMRSAFEELAEHAARPSIPAC